MAKITKQYLDYSGLNLYNEYIFNKINNKQSKITGIEGQVVQINSSGNAVASDLNLITVGDIDTICGSAIQYAEEVKF